jgi:hypothetical protein
MAQSAVTVTPPNPTPPTNFAFTGVTGPNPPNFTKNTMNDPKNWSSVNPKDFPPPYFDKGTAASGLVFAANVAALASGSGATAGGTENTYPGGGSAYANVNNVGATPASSSVAHEGAGTETLATASVPNPSPFGQLQTVGCGPALTAGTMPVPNQTHPSSLSPATNPALASISPTSTVSGAGTQALTCTGTNFTKQSVIYVNGVAQVTTFVSATSLTATVNKKASAGTWPVTVITGGAVTTAPQTWTFT